MNTHRGFSLVEMMVTVAIGGIVLAGIARSFPMFQKFMLFNRNRQQAQNEARMTLDMTRHLISRAQPRTFMFFTPSGCVPACLPDSHATFTTSDGLSYEIGWSSAPIGTVFYRAIIQGQPPIDHKLAENVSVFSFGFAPNDSAAVTLKFTSESNLDHSGQADSVYRLDLPLETIRMEGS